MYVTVEVVFNETNSNSVADHALGNSVGAIGWLVRAYFLTER